MKRIVNPIIAEVREQYVNYRKSGKTREEAVALMHDYYSEELMDIEDGAIVLSGLVFALADKKELYEELVTCASCAIAKLRVILEPDDARKQILEIADKYIMDPSVWGSAAAYNGRKKYTSSWMIGDVFSHAIETPSAKSLGLNGWFIIMYKKGEHVDEFGKVRHLMYVSLCPPEKIPTTPDQLADLGYLGTVKRDQGWEYLVQLGTKSKKEELSYKLTKIANFEKVKLPDNEIIANPLTAMPMIAKIKVGVAYPGYEDQVLMLYKAKKGLTANNKIQDGR